MSKPLRLLLYFIIGYFPAIALADEELLRQYVGCEAKQLEQQRVQLDQQKILKSRPFEDYANAHLKAIRDGKEPPPWVKDYEAALKSKQSYFTAPVPCDEQRRAAIHTANYLKNIEEQRKRSTTMKTPTAAIGVIATVLIGLTALCVWTPWRRLYALAAPVPGTGISRFEIILFWIGGISALLIMEFHRSYRGVLAVWIPLTLIAITRRFWR